jgi:hypothetical protein
MFSNYKKFETYRVVEKNVSAACLLDQFRELRPCVLQPSVQATLGSYRFFS